MRLLLAEEEKSLSKALVTILEYNHYSVDAVYNGEDGIHAEIDKYDDLEELTTPSYDDGGYVYLDNAKIDKTSVDDGIQADTFIYITNNSNINILAGDGAPSTITETSSDNANGKGIKVRAIDYGSAGTDLEWDGYLLYIDTGNININSNDDALHSNGELVIEGGAYTISSGDDGIHSDNLLQIYDGDITINKCYEGIELAKVEILGGDIDVFSSEDGINAADGTSAIPDQANPNCHILISGGNINVDCVGREGDGIDSNGSVLINGGYVYVNGSSSNGDAALDSDGGILVDGGYLFAVGQLGMVETPASNSAQYVVSYARNQSISASTNLYLCNNNGDILTELTTSRSYQYVIISCPKLTLGEEYNIYGAIHSLRHLQ